MEFGLFVPCHRFDERVSQVSHRIFTGLFRNEATVKGGFTSPVPVEDEYAPEQLLANLVAGSPATCVEKLSAYEALGVSQFIVYAAFGPDHGRTMASPPPLRGGGHAPLHTFRGRGPLTDKGNGS